MSSKANTTRERAKNDVLANTKEQRLINMIYDVMVYDFDAGIWRLIASRNTFISACQ